MNRETEPTPDPDPASEIADVAGLFADEPAPSSSPPVASSGPTDEAAGIYELDPTSPPPPTPTPRVEPPPIGRPRSEPSKSFLTTTPEPVEQVWSRWAESGPDFLRIGMVAAVTVFLVRMTFSLEQPTLPLLVLVLGGLTMLVLSYPILITLERPVRVTPERAIKDFYDALAHHRPHFRRMWLLLTTSARTSSEFGSFEGFRAYWMRRLTEFRADKAGAWTPLVFLIERYKSEKSGGKETLHARFEVQVFVRGRRADGPVAVIPVEMDLARGPDGMWYLGRGTLP